MSIRSLPVFGAALALLFSACTGTGAESIPASPGTASSPNGPGSQSNPPASGGSPAPAVALDSEESAFATLINNYREQNNLSPFKVSIALTQASKWMSGDMASKNYFSHTDSLGRDPFTRMAAFGYNYGGYSGENIAAGNADAQDTFTQWQSSPPHNANMLDANYLVIGVGRASNPSSDYDWYWTTDFGSTVDATL